jgi:DNA-binding transcriptional LysR family regulator
MKVIPSYGDLAYFLEIMDAKNLSRASERLGVSQPTLTQALKRLEDSVGESLFVRARTGLTPTRAAVVLREKATMLMRVWQDVVEETQRAQRQVSGRLKIGCHVSVAWYALPVFVPTLLKEHPKLELSFTHALSREVMERVINRELDFGLAINPRRHPDLVIRVIGRDRVGLWSAKGGAEDVLICDPDLSQTQVLMKSSEKKSTRFSRQIESRSLEIVARLAQEGAGVAVLPEKVASLFPGLKPISDSPWFKDELCLIYRQDLQKSAASQAFIQAVAQAQI